MLLRLHLQLVLCFLIGHGRSLLTGAVILEAHFGLFFAMDGLDLRQWLGNQQHYCVLDVFDPFAMRVVHYLRFGSLVGLIQVVPAVAV